MFPNVKIIVIFVFEVCKYVSSKNYEIGVSAHLGHGFLGATSWVNKWSTSGLTSGPHLPLYWV